MRCEAENLIDSIYDKLKMTTSKKLNLSRQELKEFVFYLLKNN